MKSSLKHGCYASILKPLDLKAGIPDSLMDTSQLTVADHLPTLTLCWADCS